MLDILTFRILSGVLLGSAILLLYLTRRSPSEGRTPYIPAAVRRVPKAMHTVWLIVTAPVPLGALFVAIVLPQLIYQTPLNLAFAGDLYVQLAGVVLFALGGAILVWSDRHLGRFMVVDIAVARDHQLITSGPYSYVRHPTYTGILLVTLGAAALFLNAVLIVNFLLVLAIATWRARLEEELLSSEQAFGTRYREYVGRTGRFLPRSFRGYESARAAHGRTSHRPRLTPTPSFAIPGRRSTRRGQ